jgi:NAD(P)-dependent dehydrogenase (short-subunit alcohol dehydrogenase family)
MTSNETKTAIVTGGSRGFGRAVAHDLVARGWHVVLDGRDPDVLAATAAELGPRAVAIRGDVGDAHHRRALVAAAEAHGGLHLLLNNASLLGPSPLPPLRALPVADLAEVLAANVVAPLALIQAALPLLRISGGDIVNVTSDAAVEAYEGWGGYGASKAALDLLSSVLAVEEPGLRVWSFDPGDMRTAMHQAAYPGRDIGDRPLPESVVPALRRLLQERPPSGRVWASDLLDAVAS